MAILLVAATLRLTTVPVDSVQLCSFHLLYRLEGLLVPCIDRLKSRVLVHMRGIEAERCLDKSFSMTLMNMVD
jgi:hypothetical protein